MAVTSSLARCPAVRMVGIMQAGRVYMKWGIGMAFYILVSNISMLDTDTSVLSHPPSRGDDADAPHSPRQYMLLLQLWRLRG